MFQHMKDDDQLLEVICDHLKPVIYPESSYMIREGDPLDRMLIITQGTAWAYTNNSVHNDNINNNISNNGAQSSINSPNSMSASSSSNNKRRSSSTRRLKKCDYFGEELLEWSMTHITISDFPISTINVKRNLPPNSADSQANGQRWESSALSAFRTFRDGNKKKKPINSSAAQLAEDGAKYQSSKYQRLRK
ncbi:cAMP-dependent protein kinase regulatory subunit [Parasponia andersonii]|uniref:cAMP-dependent protein kinase regulatory subunit n=1 Tax=Parasponia andersonii TaxID=3476 RepID=A0A2P5BMU5_PARAD|nr:cAMP-dependent protein kinase regulatory subunit [Parasponia andersonii]